MLTMADEHIGTSARLIVRAIDPWTRKSQAILSKVLCEKGSIRSPRRPPAGGLRDRCASALPESFSGSVMKLVSDGFLDMVASGIPTHSAVLACWTAGGMFGSSVLLAILVR